MENENFVLVEDDGKTIIPNKQLTPFEELHCAEYVISVEVIIQKFIIALKMNMLK